MLPKVFESQAVEAKWYAHWEKNHYFKANLHSNKTPYCLVMPPPNVTGVLHMGHALVNTVQDVLIRWHRMRGFETLWIPGTDHAGISTQTVVERYLIKTLNKRRTDFNREEFLTHVWDWKVANEKSILNQLRCLGCSCDWSHLRFTMDKENNQAVRTVFKKLYDDQLIYRGDYLVNWDPVTQTALADDEVEYEEKNSFLWYFNYPLKNGMGFACVATTRPETLLGDTAIAVNPKDKRYSHLIGQVVQHPLLAREIPIIADPFVEIDFGTGMVKITPAHDPNDYQLGLTHQLPFINIMTPDGKINQNGAAFAGLTMEDARYRVIEEMKNKGLLVKTVPHVHRVGISYRSKAIIEPYLSKQWFIRMDGFAPQLKAAVTQGKLKLIPKNWENTYFHWIDNLRDWCISRQLWWGHRIPIWYHRQDPTQMVCWDGEEVPPHLNQEEWVQDEDVLDTWFSSALWPFSTLGWPEKSAELTRYYPNSVLVTGHDILFFWVARMALMGIYALGELPFPETFLHGLIYGKSYWRSLPNGSIQYVSAEERLDYEKGKTPPAEVHSKWEKMSKSKGNIIDPLEVIKEYGTDAMRMALCASNPQAREIDLDLRRFEEFKNFANKIWNGARFVFLHLEANEAEGTALTAQEFSQGLDSSLFCLEDHWILATLKRTVKEVNQHLTAYQFDQAALKAYDFFWKEFCASYVEIAKPILFGKTGQPGERKNKQKLLVIVLCQAIRLIHPMAPFITEELFQHLKERLTGLQLTDLPAKLDACILEAIQALTKEACIISNYPQALDENEESSQIEADFALISRIVYTIRNIRGEINLPPHLATDIYLVGQPDDPHFQVIKGQLTMISALVRLNKIEAVTEEPIIGFAGTGVLDRVKILLPLPDEMIKQEMIRLEKEQEKLSTNLSRLKIQLDKRDFIEQAPAALVDKQRQLLQQTENELTKIAEKLQKLKA